LYPLKPAFISKVMALDLNTVQQSLGVKFKDKSLLEQALVHDSYVNENPDFAPTSNERLEFLGDAVLGAIIAEKLYQDFPAYAEGKLSQIRANLVRRDTLARVAERIQLGSYLFLGKGEETSNGRHKTPNLAGVLEAMIGAIFLDQGLKKTREFVLELMAEDYGKIVSAGTEGDYKSKLQEVVQAKEQQTPIYVLTSATGPDHDRWFSIEVRLGEKIMGRGEGKSKKMAESEAARDALEKLRPES
jgi:ribonuclease-3